MKKKTAANIFVSRLKSAPDAPPPVARTGASQKLTTTLFPADMEAIRGLIDLVQTHCGGFPKRADAIKVALRIALEVAQPEQIKRHMDAVKREDGRYKGKM